MNRIGFWWDIKTANIEYYDIQYAADRTTNQADIQAILPTHELVIFTKFHNDWMKIVDFFINGPFLGKGTFLFTSL